MSIKNYLLIIIYKKINIYAKNYFLNQNLIFTYERLNFYPQFSNQANYLCVNSLQHPLKLLKKKRRKRRRRFLYLRKKNLALRLQVFFIKIKKKIF